MSMCWVSNLSHYIEQAPRPGSPGGLAYAGETQESYDVAPAHKQPTILVKEALNFLGCLYTGIYWKLH